MFPSTSCELPRQISMFLSLHLGRKYARIFVLGHYLFLEAHDQKTTHFGPESGKTDFWHKIKLNNSVKFVTLHPFKL